MRQCRVKGLANGLLELGLADGRPLAAGAGIDHQYLGLGRVLPQQGLQADRIAQTGKAALANDDHPTCRGQHKPLRRRHPARQINDDPGEFAAQLVEEHIDRAGVDHQRLADRGLGGEDAQRVRCLDHRPIDEQGVDARRLFQGFAQTGARIRIEIERHRAEMQIEVDERGVFLVPVGKQPSAADGRCRGPDAAAAADEGNDLAEARAGPAGCRARLLFEAKRERLAGERLDEVIRSAGREQIAEQTDVVHGAERQDLEIGAADRPRGAELGNRRGRFGEIHNEDARERPLADLSQGGFERRFEGQVVIELLITDASLDPVEGRLILQDGDDAFAIRLLRGRRRGGDGGGCSHG